MKLIILFLFLIPILLTAQETDSSYTLEFKTRQKSKPDMDIDWSKENLIKEFELKGKLNSKYSIQILDEDNSILSKFINGKWIVVDTITHSLEFNDSITIFLPSYTVTDFDKDGNEDLYCFVSSNMNGNSWTIIYLMNQQTNNLQKLNNIAENSDYIWDAPVYNKKDKTIHCTRVSGNFGKSFESVYRLENQIALPLKKYETDNTKMDEKGEGGVKRKYIGKNGKWILIMEKRNSKK